MATTAINLGSRYEAVALTARLLNAAGGTIEETTEGFTYIGGGSYSWTYTVPAGCFLVAIVFEDEVLCLVAVASDSYSPDSLPPTSFLLADRLKRDAQQLVAHFGEGMTYHSNNTSKSIQGIATRNTYRKASDGNTMVDDLTVLLLNDAVSGVTSVIVGRDKITFSAVWGGSSSSHTITKILNADAGSIEVRLS